nr:MAG TPA: hypothetical protein [Caudoviricetes sp.]
MHKRYVISSTNYCVIFHKYLIFTHIKASLISHSYIITLNISY